MKILITKPNWFNTEKPWEFRVTLGDVKVISLLYYISISQPHITDEAHHLHYRYHPVSLAESLSQLQAGWQCGMGLLFCFVLFFGKFLLALQVILLSPSIKKLYIPCHRWQTYHPRWPIQKKCIFLAAEQPKKGSPKSFLTDWHECLCCTLIPSCKNACVHWGCVAIERA